MMTETIPLVSTATIAIIAILLVYIKKVRGRMKRFVLRGSHV